MRHASPIRARTTKRCQLKVFSLAALELLDTLKDRGARLSLDGDNIVVKGFLTDDLRDQIREHKQGLIDLMEDGEHLWQKVAEWQFWREGDRMMGRRLDAPGEKSWPIENTDCSEIEKNKRQQSRKLVNIRA